MRLTTAELAEMQSVDIGAVSADMLTDANDLRLDPALSQKERVARLLAGTVNPYIFSVNGVGVKIEFAEDGPTLQDTLTDFLIRQKSGL